jgi:hypothetical protein
VGTPHSDNRYATRPRDVPSRVFGRDRCAAPRARRLHRRRDHPIVQRPQLRTTLLTWPRIDIVQDVLRRCRVDPVPEVRIRHRHRQMDGLRSHLNIPHIRRDLTQQIQRRPRPLFDRKPHHVAGASQCLMQGQYVDYIGESPTTDADRREPCAGYFAMHDEAARSPPGGSDLNGLTVPLCGNGRSHVDGSAGSAGQPR